jgi:hypothetical protein
MTGFHDLRRRVIERALSGPGVTSAEARRAAFDTPGTDPRAARLLETVAAGAWAVSDADVAGALQAGMTDDEVFELVVCAALGQAERQLAAAMTAVARATADRPEGQA